MARIKKKKAWHMFNEGGKEEADRERLKIKERAECGGGGGSKVSER